MIAIVSAAFLLLGALLALIAGAGLQRFDDVFSRLHAATKPATLGLALVLIGASLQMPDLASKAKLLLVVVFQFATAPVGSHLVGRASYRAGIPLSRRTMVDELEEADRG